MLGSLQGDRNHVKGMNLGSARGWQERGRWVLLRVNIKTPEVEKVVATLG